MTSTTDKPKAGLFAGDGQTSRKAGLRLCAKCQKGITQPGGKCGFCGVKDPRPKGGDAP